MRKTVTIITLSITAMLFIMSTSLKKETFYSAFKSSDRTKIENGIKALKTENSSTKKDAYLGALTMKSADFKKVPKIKIDVFKEGHKLFESALEKDPNNTEYHFMRLAIQENCPKILKYNTNIEEDKNIVVKNYNSLDSMLKKFILDYSKKSTHLSPEDFK